MKQIPVKTGLCDCHQLAQIKWISKVTFLTQTHIKLDSPAAAALERRSRGVQVLAPVRVKLLYPQGSGGVVPSVTDIVLCPLFQQLVIHVQCKLKEQQAIKEQTLQVELLYMQGFSGVVSGVPEVLLGPSSSSLLYTFKVTIICLHNSRNLLC